ncbi:helix-turn-helix transcriptional regulator [Sphingomonas sp. PP-CE-3A-406]|uniref:helix-turn-helix domain-containing protein n=1 Tax=Sphingomonas sp. PP-CE-3A-406 TaxID=2135659 RepID=UPI000EF9DB7F|nr:helix-turn-helix transcriptional regulator [Sphingomonas sp. PP-CE-3A-406]
MIEVIHEIERIRLAARISQAEISLALGVTQGHYSKVINGKAELSSKLQERMQAWIGAQDNAGHETTTARRMRQLAVSIRQQCMELMHLAGLPGEMIDGSHRS